MQWPDSHHKDIFKQSCRPTLKAYHRGSRQLPVTYAHDMEWSQALLKSLVNGEEVPAFITILPADRVTRRVDGGRLPRLNEAVAEMHAAGVQAGVVMHDDAEDPFGYGGGMSEDDYNDMDATGTVAVKVELNDDQPEASKTLWKRKIFHAFPPGVVVDLDASPPKKTKKSMALSQAEYELFGAAQIGDLKTAIAEDVTAGRSMSSDPLGGGGGDVCRGDGGPLGGSRGHGG